MQPNNIVRVCDIQVLFGIYKLHAVMLDFI